MSQKRKINEKIIEQQNVTSTSNQKTGIQFPLTSANTIESIKSYIPERKEHRTHDINILSNVAESISKDELRMIISRLKQKQSIFNMKLPNLERKEKKYKLSTLKVQREQYLSKYPTTEEIARQKLLAEHEDFYCNMNILGDSVLEYDLINTLKKPRTSIRPDEKIEQPKLKQNKLQEQEDLRGNYTLLGDSPLQHNVLNDNPSKNLQKKPEDKKKQEELRQIQIKEQEEQHGKIDILGESVLEYDVTELSQIAHNKLGEQAQENNLKIPKTTKKEKKQILRQKSLQDQNLHNKNISGETIVEHSPKFKKPSKIPEEDIEQKQLRQIQLDEQEEFYEHMDLLGETTVKFSPIEPMYSSQNIAEHKASLYKEKSTPISPEEPQTSTGPRRISKYLSPEQITQLAKIRKQRYEQQDDIQEETFPNVLKEHYSFRNPNARLQSPRELVFRKSIVDVKKNRGQYSKSLAMPVINFPPTNWPTPIIPDITLEKESLREEQRKYFQEMQQVRAQQQKQQTPQIVNVMPNQEVKEVQNQIQNQNVNPSRNIQYKMPRIILTPSVLIPKEVRYHYFKRVFLLLTIQWLLITGIVGVFKYSSCGSWLKSSSRWAWVYILTTFMMVVTIFKLSHTARKTLPINCILLFFFTILVTFMFSFAEVYFPNDAIMLALLCTCIMCIIFILFFQQTRCNFNFFFGIGTSVAIFSVLSILGFFMVGINYLHIIYAFIGVILYTVYIVWDTNAMLKGTHKYDIKFDNYILGVIHLNLDFIFIPIDKITP